MLPQPISCLSTLHTLMVSMSYLSFWGQFFCLLCINQLLSLILLKLLWALQLVLQPMVPSWVRLFCTEMLVPQKRRKRSRTRRPVSSVILSRWCNWPTSQGHRCLRCHLSLSVAELKRINGCSKWGMHKQMLATTSIWYFLIVY